MQKAYGFLLAFIIISWLYVIESYLHCSVKALISLPECPVITFAWLSCHTFSNGMAYVSCNFVLVYPGIYGDYGTCWTFHKKKKQRRFAQCAQHEFRSSCTFPLSVGVIQKKPWPLGKHCRVQQRLISHHFNWPVSKLSAGGTLSCIIQCTLICFAQDYKMSYTVNGQRLPAHIMNRLQFQVVSN